MYAEHETLAVGLIIIGILIIIFAFYKELLNIIGLNDFEDVDTESNMPKPRNKRNNK